MNKSDIILWFDEIAQRPIKKDTRIAGFSGPGASLVDYNYSDLTRWLTDAESALRSVFPTGHATIQRWEKVLAQHPPSESWRYMLVDGARGVFESARAQIKDGRLSGLIDAIKSETVNELLDQAETLASKGYAVAAMTVAGGALETFLRRLCERNSVQWSGQGSITNYETALAKERNAGKVIVSATNGKLITGWGGLRNDAAHTPGQFTRTPGEVALVITQIRSFVAQHS